MLLLEGPDPQAEPGDQKQTLEDRAFYESRR